MTEKKIRRHRKRVQTWIKATLAVSLPLFLIAAALSALLLYAEGHRGKVLPHTSVAGVDVSGLSREEAMHAVGVRAYDERGERAMVTIALPGDALFSITGEEAGLANNANLMVDAAYANGRGGGFIDETMEALSHMRTLRRYELLAPLAAEDASYDISYTIDAERLRNAVTEFTRRYNDELEGSGLQVVDGTIVIVKGAGFVRASESELYALAYNGLFESLSTGYPVYIEYSLPESTGDTAELVAIRQSIMTDPLSAEYDPESQTISPGVVGVDIDLESALALLAGAETGTVVMINVEYTQPEITAEHLESLLFRDLIGECVTQIPGTENRLNNILLATAAVNGLVLEPGEEFSFNRVVGQRTPERGFRLAPAFSNGTTVQAIGGGICQVSSTLYSSVMDTGLRVTERHPHGLPVSYIPRGRDATVNWGSLDFRFVNNTEYPLRIDAEVDGRTLTVQVYGTIVEGGTVAA